MEINDADVESSDLWGKSRRGAWAGRGFHYQHLFSTHLLVRQWAGVAPAGALVPEGLDDCVVELADRAVWIQIKSRKGQLFRPAEVEAFWCELEKKATRITTKGGAIETVVALEQPCQGANEIGIAQLFDAGHRRVVCSTSPEGESVRLLSQQLSVAEVIAEGIVSDLYKLVADASQANASLPFESRRRISTTEVERRIFERLEAEDPSAIDQALISGAIEPVDFITPVAEPSFYQGVKVGPGHVAAGLVKGRREETAEVVRIAKERRHVLVTGPSGSGKSALLWISASALSGESRLFQITSRAVAADAAAIIRFVRARRPTGSSPLGLVFYEVGSPNSDLWNVLVRELRSVAGVYFLGSIRQEDMELVTDRADTEVVPVQLSEGLAQTVWEKLVSDGQTAWEHWREPFEMSEGLMLEYVHLLTQGKRLAAVIEEQVRQREREGRIDELAILRGAAVLGARGGEIDTAKLFETLGIDRIEAGRALRRLLDEHLVRESRPGVLGVLHTLRSEALCRAAHDEVSFLSSDSLWRCLPAATSDTLPAVIQSVLKGVENDVEAMSLQSTSKEQVGTRLRRCRSMPWDRFQR